MKKILVDVLSWLLVGLILALIGAACIYGFLPSLLLMLIPIVFGIALEAPRGRRSW